MTSLVLGALNPSDVVVFGGINDAVVVVQPTAPAKPVLSTTSGNGTVTASWAPTSDGGSPIRSWLVRVYTISEGNAPPAPTPVTDPNARTFTFSGLVNGTDYLVDVAAVNDIGASPFAQAGASPAVPGVPPNPPTGITPVPIDTGIALSLTPPANMGTGTLTGYRVTVTDTGNSTVYPYSLIAAPATLLGLLNDRQVSVEVRTVTTDGVSGGATAFATPTEHPPSTTPPGAPTGGSTTPHAGALDVTWTAPAVAGTYPVLDYVLRATTTGGGQFTHWYASTSVGTTIGGLGNDVDWIIDIWARSAAGKSLTTLSLVGRPISTGDAVLSPLSPYADEPPLTPPATNPVYWAGYVPPDPTDVANPDVPPPPPVHLDAPNIFAFYPAGSMKADETTSDGAFSPTNWAGL